jgi:SAM-dependent methyltransferase
MPTYNATVFEVGTLKAAQEIILTAEGDSSTGNRWVAETPYLMQKLKAATDGIWPRLFLDFGCGVGRLSREIVREEGCAAIGVDASVSMRKMAAEYVASSAFTACGPLGLDRMVVGGLRYDVALSVWVLQHCLDPAAELDRIGAGLRSGGLFFIVDMHHRAVPTDQGWLDDGQSIRSLADARFVPLSIERFAAPDAPANLLESGWIGVYRKP